MHDPEPRLDALETVIAQVTRPVALVGASMGGVTAMRAIVDGLRPSALILVDIVLRPDPVGVARIRDFMRGNPSGFASLEAAADAVGLAGSDAVLGAEKQWASRSRAGMSPLVKRPGSRGWRAGMPSSFLTWRTVTGRF